jgi:hypothetical protein
MPTNKGKVNKVRSKDDKATVKAMSTERVSGEVAATGPYRKAIKAGSAVSKTVKSSVLGTKSSWPSKKINKRVNQSVVAKGGKPGSLYKKSE